jgi:hypothetical protein
MAATAGYSGTPLVKKLGIEAGQRVALLQPALHGGFRALLVGLPAGVKPVSDPRGRGPFDLVVLFAPDVASLRARLEPALRTLDPDGALWVSWPKKSSARFRDLTEDGVRAAALPLGLVDVKVCAVDEDWSGLKLVVRRENRPSR